MEKTTLFIFYNLFMMSMYTGIDFLKPFILYTLSIVYISIVLVINFKLQEIWGTVDNRSEKMALLSWQYLWGVILILLIGRDLEYINDIGLISAFILFLVLSFTAITSCYVILMDSRHWTTQMLMTASLHWILFHDNESWISSSMYVLSLPLIVMFVLRIIFYIEKNENITYAIIETIVFLIIFAFEFEYDRNNTSSILLFTISSLGFFIIIVTQNDRFTNIIVFGAPFIVPIVYTLILVYIYRLGWKLGIATSLQKINNMWKKWSGEEIKLLKTLAIEGIIAFDNSQLDDML